MANLTIHNLEESIKALLSIRADHNGHSIEEEARQILCNALLEDANSSKNLAEVIQQRFAEINKIDRIPTISREPMREPPQFE